MSYTTIHQCASDQPFVARLHGRRCAGGHEQPEVRRIVPALAGGVGERHRRCGYESAVISGNENLQAATRQVITDATILAKVQSLLPGVPPLSWTATAGTPPA